MPSTTFDLDVLRTFVAGVDAGTFAAAATRVGRSPSAVSAQLRRLEEQAGTAVLRKDGRGLALTEAGETLLAYARRMLELNDEAATRLRGADLAGWARLGVQEDFGESLLPDVLGRFARSHPRVRVEARVGRNADLLERVASGKLDLALVWGRAPRAERGRRLATVRMRWIGATGSRAAALARSDAPLPLLAFEKPCCFRSAATRALDRAGVPWRVAFTSSSLAGLFAAAAAGLGVTIRTSFGMPGSVRVLPPRASGLPVLPSTSLSLVRSATELAPAPSRLGAIVAAAVRAALAG